MKLALVFPRFKYPSGDMPLGIGYIASNVLKHFPETKLDLIDTTFEDDPLKYVDRIFKQNKYDFVGISVMTTMLRDAFKIASIIKKYNPETKVMFGGPHPTVMPEETLNNEHVDCVVIAEGEETIVDIIKNSSFEGVAGLWYKQDGKITKNDLRRPMEDLDLLPHPVRDLFPFDDYIKNNTGLDSVRQKLKCIGILASRGCPYRCSYCQPTLNKLFGKKVRIRSTKNIIEELAYLKKTYKIDSFMFLDDTFIIHKKWVYEFCDELIKSDLNLIWFCNVRANLVEYDMLSKMYESGLRKVGIGIESGSQRVLDEIYNKDITTEQVEESVKIIRSLGLKIQGYVMLGAPTETREEIMQTIRFAKSLDIEEAAFSITTPLPHTTLYEKSKKLIKDDVADFDYYNKSVYKSTGELTPKEIESLKKRAYLEFYCAPKRLPQTLKSFLSVKKMIHRFKRF